MAETSPSPNENTAAVTSIEINRLRRRSNLSLALSVLVLALIVIGAIIHHHRMHLLANRDGHGGGHFAGQCQMGFGQRFHRFGGMGMNRGWGRPDGVPGNRNGGPGGPSPGRPGIGGVNATTGGPIMIISNGGKPNLAGMTADGILDHLSTTLTLTDDQKAKIKPIIEQQLAEIQKQMEAQRTAMQKQIEEAKAKIKPLLTADQQKQLDAIPLPGQKPPAPEPGPGQ